jgi:ubiquinone/menaquinone biosynthesis C-methylase UbiE
MTSTMVAPDPSVFETIGCYYCGETACTDFVSAQDDLTGKPGNFRFVTCNNCGLAYQTPRIRVEHIPAWYDDEYISHRKKTNWGILTPLYNRAMNKHDRDKDALISRYVKLGPESQVVDVGCGSGTFLARIHDHYGSQVSGVDFKNLTHLPSFQHVKFHHGLFYEQNLPENAFDLVTMWHFLEHDYDPVRTLATARNLLKPDGRLIIEIPRLDSVTFRMYRERWPGLQAPQHTVLYTKQMLLKFIERSDLEVVEYLPYGAFPPYFYLFTGLAFKFLKGRGLNLSKAIYPYFFGQFLVWPVLLFQRHLNLAMQTVICRRPA